MALFWWIFGWLCCCCPCGDDLRAIGSVAWNPYNKKGSGCIHVLYDTCKRRNTFAICFPSAVYLVDVGLCGEDGGCDGLCDCGTNLLWMITFGWLFFLAYCLLAILTLPLCICGLDFAEQHWKLARLSLMPSGADIHKRDYVSDRPRDRDSDSA